MERDYGCCDNPPDWLRFRYEPLRHHSPENEGEDHGGYKMLLTTTIAGWPGK